jgi:hypothetical protein
MSCITVSALLMVYHICQPVMGEPEKFILTVYAINMNICIFKPGLFFATSTSCTST